MKKNNMKKNNMKKKQIYKRIEYISIQNKDTNPEKSYKYPLVINPKINIAT